VIGIVAARLVEHFGRPVALLAGEGDGRLRASVRAPAGFAVDAALQACSDLLERHGGHPAAGGFTVRAEQLAALHSRLNDRAETWLNEQGGGPLLEPEALVTLAELTPAFWQQLQRLEPFGIGHAAPLFWSSRCRIVQQRQLRGGHLQLTLEQAGATARAIAWRWSGDWNLPAEVDVAFLLRLNRWQGQEQLQLELRGLRTSTSDTLVLQRQQRQYWVRREGEALVIRNAAGEELRSPVCSAGSGGSTPASSTPACNRPGGSTAGPNQPREEHPYVRALFRDAAMALGLAA
jgi:single-stranded-DNA-specific exonuclease